MFSSKHYNLFIVLLLLQKVNLCESIFKEPFALVFDLKLSTDAFCGFRMRRIQNTNRFNLKKKSRIFCELIFIIQFPRTSRSVAPAVLFFIAFSIFHNKYEFLFGFNPF